MLCLPAALLDVQDLAHARAAVEDVIAALVLELEADRLYQPSEVVEVDVLVMPLLDSAPQALRIHYLSLAYCPSIECAGSYGS